MNLPLLLLSFSLPSTIFPSSSWSSSFFLADYWVNLAYLSRHPSSGPQPFYSLFVFHSSQESFDVVCESLRFSFIRSTLHGIACVSLPTPCVPWKNWESHLSRRHLAELVHAPLNPDSARETTWALRTRGGDNDRRGDEGLPSARTRRPREVVNCPR
jgi:hypothetical protein